MSKSLDPTTVCSLAGRYDNPMPESTISPQPGTKNLVSGATQKTVEEIEERRVNVNVVIIILNMNQLQMTTSHFILLINLLFLSSGDMF